MNEGFNPNAPYSRARVDRVEREKVTDAMIGRAINVDGRRSIYGDAEHQRARTRRNIAIGIACGSYREGGWARERAVRPT